MNIEPDLKFSIEERVEVLRSIPLFSEIDILYLWEIAKLLTEKVYQAKQVIFNKNDISHSFYIILNGALRVYDKDHEFCTLQAGDFFGEYAIFDNQPRSASVATIEESRLLVLDKDEFFKISDFNKISISLINQLTKRLRQNNDSEIEISKEIQTIKKEKKNLEFENNFILRQSDKVAHEIQTIRSSIKSAKRIQRALLPSKEYLFNFFPEHFVLYKPRDIVSGDFYWAKRKDNVIVFAVADCTGHGVPGAFMSMLGIANLNDIVDFNPATKASDILANLRFKIIESLNQTLKVSKINEEMTIALCIYDVEKKHLQYAGSYNPLYIVREGTLLEYKADRISVGSSAKEEIPFNNMEIELFKEDCIYLFSDGIIDQLGETDGKRFGSNAFKELILKNSLKSMKIQRELIKESNKDWKGKNRQIDDILVFGLKI